MNKGMFYLLPFLVFTPAAASNALPQVEATHLLNVLEQVRKVEVPRATIMSSKPISGRNLNGRRVIKQSKPRAGRNASRLLLKKRPLVRRK